MPYLIDSDVLIDISQGIKAAREYVDALTEEWGISQVSALELIVGTRDQRELATTDAFLSAYAIITHPGIHGQEGLRTPQAVRETPWLARL
jgi:predicted nucleic acid-binding protein